MEEEERRKEGRKNKGKERWREEMTSGKERGEREGPFPPCSPQTAMLHLGISLHLHPAGFPQDCVRADPGPVRLQKGLETFSFLWCLSPVSLSFRICKTATLKAHRSVMLSQAFGVDHLHHLHSDYTSLTEE